MIAVLCSGCMTYMIAILHSGSWTYFACVTSQHRGTLDSELFLPFCAQATWTYSTAILWSGHTDLYDHHFVLRSHRPVQLAFCTQVTWTYYISHSSTYNLHLNITMLPSAIPTYHSSPQCTHVPFYKLCHYKY